MMSLVSRREAIMARGAKRRDAVKEQFWRETIGRQASSGLSISGYCRRHRLRGTAFYFWRRELARRGVSVTASPAFVPVRLTAESPGVGCIEIILPGGRQVRLHGPVDRQSLVDVLAALEGSPC
jgi:hypothetical protein